MSEDNERILRLEARLDAMSTLIKSVLTTLMLRGVLTKPVIDQILTDSAHAVEGSNASAVTELQALRDDLPAHLRAAMGPPPDDDDHDH
jgi:hypothetical protein